MKLIRDTWLLFGRDLTATLRNPVWLIIGLFQPICFLLLFAPLLNSIANAPGFPPGGALTVFTPGMLVMMGLYGAAFVGFGLIADLRAGVIERLRVTPVSRLALLLGRALRDVLVVQSAVMLLVAWPLGLRADLSGMALAFGILDFGLRAHPHSFTRSVSVVGGRWSVVGQGTAASRTAQ
jgi:ABC-2 type transport system permease protein